MSARIEDYALIGDLETAALVGKNGSIDWMCVPRFDSPAWFAALVGSELNGFWRIAPAGAEVCSRRAYLPDTLVLETVWETANSAVKVVDFMPVRTDAPRLVRRVEGISGRTEMQGELCLRFNNGRVKPWTRRLGSRTVSSVAGPDSAYLTADATVETSVSNDRSVSTFSVSAGEHIDFVLTWNPSHIREISAIDPDAARESTMDFWRSWTAGCQYRGPCREPVTRSLITLKALTHRPTGGVIAAATSSLPERLGGERNWDYRFCWLRDSTFTLSCLLRSGYRSEAVAWNDWLLRAVAGEPSDLQPLYGVAGQRRLVETTAPWLEGYEQSRPVRFGNAASEQLQLDVYGEILNTIYSAMRAGVPMDEQVWHLVGSLMHFVEKNWTSADAGFWEVRGPERHFLHSKVMSWVAADRAVKMARIAGMSGSAARWRAMRSEIRAQVLREGWDERRQSFTQYYGSREVDATVFLLPKLGFLRPDDPRLRATLRTAEKELMINGFVRRYTTAEGENVDGMAGPEGTFLACSLWYADALAMTGEAAKARDVLESVLDVRNDVGLLAEEWDPVAGRQLGNTPQAFSHVALVNTAFVLSGSRNGNRQSCGTHG